MFKRVIVVILDSAGISVLLSACYYGDFGVNTIANIAQRLRRHFLFTLGKMGLGSIHQLGMLNDFHNQLDR